MDGTLVAAAAGQRRRIAANAPSVVVLHGPASEEDRAYVRHTPAEALSWHDLRAGLRDLGARRVDAVDVTTVTDWPRTAYAADLVVPNLHGEPGEDGSVQGLLERLGVAFVGSTVEASVVGLNKSLAKLVARTGGIRTPDAVVVQGGQIVQRLGEPIDGDVVAKPLRGGSSLGVRRLAAASSWPTCGSWLLERYVHGFDVTVTVVEQDDGPTPLGAVVLEHEGDVYDAGTKLRSQVGAARPEHLAPALAECEAMAAAVHRLVGARHVSRSDFVVADGRPWFLEINTLPGLSRSSNAAESAYAAGLDYEDFLALVVGPALVSR